MSVPGMCIKSTYKVCDKFAKDVCDWLKAFAL
uniref:Uncharacterized protein n=1 Tax=Anguilla anguilla TaxID=7936 RepID=A0A0E9P5V5_ANGAN